MVSLWPAYARVRLVRRGVKPCTTGRYGQFAVCTWPAHGQYTACTQSAHGQHAFTLWPAHDQYVVSARLACARLGSAHLPVLGQHSNG